MSKLNEKMTNYRWVICSMLFFATTVNYLDRQVLSLLQPILEEEFHWTDNDYGSITAVFSLFYAVSMLFAGRFVDRVGTKKGYAWSIAVWSLGAALHAVCGVVTERWVGLENAEALRLAQGADLVAQISMVSVTAFVVCRCVLALGEAGNFPAAIKATAEYFPKKDRAFATGIFNSGANVGAIVAPLTVPVMAELWGWETAFIVVGLVGFVWLGIWQFVYKRPEENTKMNAAERAYINQDIEADAAAGLVAAEAPARKMSFVECMKYRQTWAFAFGKFMTDGVWWFFLFWTPAYLKAQYGMVGTQIAWPIAVLYTITVFGSVFGGKFPTYFINRAGKGVSVERQKAYKYEALAAGFRDRKIDPFIVTVEPAADDAPMHLNCHPGQEMNYVLEGRLLIGLNGKEIVLNTGDSLYFDSGLPHGMKALDGKTVRFLAIIM